MNRAPAATPEPEPHRNESIPLYRKVMRDVEARAEMGKEKYGFYLQAHNGRNALMDAYQEAIDLVMYLKQLLEEA